LRLVDAGGGQPVAPEGGLHEREDEAARGEHRLAHAVGAGAQQEDALAHAVSVRVRVRFRVRFRVRVRVRVS